ncbi:Hsp70 family protein [Lentzea sp. NPDC058436]|uniref:Hsp70 family protein n=1 Tax=Lentzea sp. NPDC058436 TaxID=3346499 RepID=UPI00365C9E59
MSYGLGVDLGTTYTAAAVSDASGTRAVPLGRDVTVPSVVYLTDNGDLITGEAADGEARKRPQRSSVGHKRRLADPAPLKIGEAVRSPAALMAAQLRDVIAFVTATQRCAPESVVLTCPAVWGPYRREHFSEVPRLAGLKNWRIITEPEAAAMHHSVERRLGDGELIGVYDLGGGTFDATVLRARPHGMEILGTPEGVEQLGGIDFDQSLLTFVDSRLDGEIGRLDPADPEQARALHGVRQACKEAKEALSTEPDTVLHLALPDGPRKVKVSRSEFNQVIKPHLDLTTEALIRSVSSAGLKPTDLASVLLVGGSSRIPLVTHTVSTALGKPLRRGLHPKLGVALGAATVARHEITKPRHTAPTPQRIPLPPAPPPRVGPPSVTGPFTPHRPSLPAGPPEPTTPMARFGRRRLVFAAAAAAALLCAGTISAVVLTGDGPDTSTAPVGRTSPDSPAPSSQPPDFVRDGKDVSPFRSLIGSDANWTGTPLSADGSVTQPAISVSPADVNSTRDGRKVTWTGNGAGQFYLQNSQGKLDARPFLKSGTLTFDVVLLRAPTAQVSLAMHCHYPCQAPLNATGLFQQLPPGQKTTVRIPLECFASGGLDPSNVDVPFLVHTTAPFEATFAQLRWESAGTDAGGPVTPCASLS